MDYLLALAADPAAWVALVTLIVMEVVLGIDNLIFISILTNKLPEHHRARARRLGIGAALVMRLALLGTIAVIVRLTEPVLTVLGHGFSWRDLILIAGGLFLVWKATKEIHHNVDPDPARTSSARGRAGVGLAAAVAISWCWTWCLGRQHITAVGMTEHIPIMVVAVLVTVGRCCVAATPLANFINATPHRDAALASC